MKGIEMADLKRRKKITSEKKSTIKEGANNYAQNPFFVKKRERAKETIAQYGIPEKFLTPPTK